MKDIMIDLETFGNNSNSVIVQLGACYFDRVTGEIGETLKLNVSAASEQENGFRMDVSTVEWWLEQSQEARESILAEPRVTTSEMMLTFNNFVKGKPKNIWSHATFDFVVLINHYRELNVIPSFKYSHAKDIRTLIHFADLDWWGIPREGTHHDALADCIFQVKYCTEAFRIIREEGLQ